MATERAWRRDHRGASPVCWVVTAVRRLYDGEVIFAEELMSLRV